MKNKKHVTEEAAEPIITEPHDELTALREDVAVRDHTLKKSLFGYSKAGVEAYVAQLDRSAEQMQASLEAQIKALSAECSKLSGENALLRRQMTSADDERDSLRQALRTAQQHSEELGQKLEAALTELEAALTELEAQQSAPAPDPLPASDAPDNLQEALAEKEALSELLSEYQAREKDYVLLRQQNEEQKAVIRDQKKTVDELLREMEQQLDQFRLLSEALQGEKDAVCRLTGEKSELQTQNLELREKQEALTRQYLQLERESMRLNRSLLSETNAAAPSPDPLPASESSEPTSDEPVIQAREISRIISLNARSLQASSN